MIDEEGGYGINLQNIIDASDICPTVRLLAIDLKKSSYLTLGTFFRKISERSLDELVDIANHAADEESEVHENAVQDLMLLTLLLAEAEGLSVENDEQLHKMINSMNVIICGASLARKGLVRMFYENLSLGEDMLDKVIMERI